MRGRAWVVVVAASLTLVALGGLAAEGSFPLAPMTGVAPRSPATPLAVGSPTAVATPADLLPLFTPIPVSEARNAVGRITIQMTDRGFIPSRFENAINQEIEITLVNSGTRSHTFTIDELEIDVELAPGKTRGLTIPSPRRLGQYIYYSDTLEDRALGMQGIMTIFI